jgi:hypothetical protein
MKTLNKALNFIPAKITINFLFTVVSLFLITAINIQAQSYCTTCQVSETRVSTQECCGDGIKNGSEECDGTDFTRAVKPANVPNNVWNDKVCNSPGDNNECRISLGEYCGDGIVNGSELCDGQAFDAIAINPGLPDNIWTTRTCIPAGSVNQCTFSFPPTATPTPVCTDVPYVEWGGWCLHNSKRTYCNGALVSDTRGAAHSCCKDVAWPHHDGRCWYNCTSRYCYWGFAGYWCGGPHSCYCPEAGRPRCYTAAGNYYAPKCTSRNWCGNCASWWCYPRGKKGCFPRGVSIQLANGHSKLVEEIAVGDLLYNPVTRKPVEVSQVVEGPEKFPIIQFGYDNLKVRVTTEHVVLTESGLKRAKDLTLQDKVSNKSGEFSQIETLVNEPVERNQSVINFIINDTENKVENHWLLSDGIITGDLYLQEKLDDLDGVDSTLE